jgi:hypothetical protein
VLPTDKNKVCRSFYMLKIGPLKWTTGITEMELDLENILENKALQS